MKARILDEAVLQAVSPAALRAYVVFEGWSKVDPYGAYSEVYTRQEDVAKELIVPFTTEIADYADAVARVIQGIAAFEERDEIAVCTDIARADRDVIRVGAVEAQEDGSIRVDPGVEIVQQARNLLASAACSAADPRQSYHLGKVQRAEDYMRRVRLGQTEQGSFVIALLAPTPPALSTGQQGYLWPHLEEEPYERQVTRMLARALHSAQESILASNRGEGLDAFLSAVPKGVSANLCEAIAAIVDYAEGAKVSVTWARTRPTPKPRDTVAFGRSDSSVLKEAARQFRLREPRRDERILGYVTRLRRSEDEFDGRVTIKAIVDGRARSIFAELSQIDYDIAVSAHKKQSPVTLIGDLENKGQRWRVIEPREIRIIEDDDE